MLQRFSTGVLVTTTLFLCSPLPTLELKCSFLEIQCGSSQNDWCCRYNQYCGDSYGLCSSYGRRTTTTPSSSTPPASWIVGILLIFFGCVCPIIWCCCRKKSLNATAPDNISSPRSTGRNSCEYPRHIELDSTHNSRVWSIYNDEAPPPSYEAAIANLQAKNTPIVSCPTSEETSRL